MTKLTLPVADVVDAANKDIAVGCFGVPTAGKYSRVQSGRLGRGDTLVSPNSIGL